MSFRGLSIVGPQVWSLLASLLVHGLVIAGVLSLPALAQPEVTEEDVVSVAVVTPDQLQSASDAAKTRNRQTADPAPEPPEPTAGPLPADPAAPPELPELPESSESSESSESPESPELPKPPESSQARPRETAQRIGPRMPSGKPVAIPRPRVVPKDKTVLAGDRQREQLCHSAALIEIAKARPDLKPDLVISSAVDATLAADNVIVANGAAFRSEGRWFRFKFRCVADPAEDRVMSFDYLIGGPFPEDEVEVRKVTAGN